MESSVIENLRQRWWPEIYARIDRCLQSESFAGSELATMTRYQIDTGGKRIRAVLPLAVAETLKLEVDAFLDLGAACELLHNATLIHDDIQDGDTMRRGRETLWMARGVAQAINVGDAMFFWSIRALYSIRMPENLRLQLIAILVDHILRAIQGQTLEFMIKGQSHVRIADYIEVVEGKTSGLFSLPLVGSMLLAEASGERIGEMAEAARHLGVLFQIQDDVLDLIGDKGRGQRGNDIREGKPTYPVVVALERLTDANRVELLRILGAPRENTTDEEVQVATAMLMDTSAIADSLTEIKRRRDAILSAVRDPRLSTLLDTMVQEILRPIMLLDDPES